MYITTLIYNNYICTYTPKKNKMYSILFGLSILYGLLPILMDFSFSFFPSSYIGCVCWGFWFFRFRFFEKSLILCFVRIVFLLWLFLFGSSVFSFWSDFYFDVSPRPLNDRRTKY